MRVHVLYFGWLKDLLQTSDEVMELPAGSTATSVFERAAKKAAGHGAVSQPVWGSLAVAVNQEYVVRERVLAEGDEVALLPPVSGG